MATVRMGYFAGEFGWHLQWQGTCRYIASRYQDKEDKIIVGCEPQYRFLYEDFATEFIDFPYAIESRNMWMTNDKVYHMETGNPSIPIGIFPDRELCIGENIKRIFPKWGYDNKELYCDFLIHARSTNNLGTSYRNYNVEKWEKLLKPYISAGLKIVSIGSVSDAYYINNTADGRNLDLGFLADIMASSKMIIGPSSGPMHFASLCGLKHIVWSDDSGGRVMNNEKRYKETWNHHNTECQYIKGWQPEVSVIRKAIEKWL